jgi:hypothetical protein
MRHDWQHVMRRSALLLALLTACGRRPPADDDRGKPPPVPPLATSPGDGDDRCDPRQSRLCLGNDVVACEPDGKLGRRLQACHEGCEDGQCVPSCSDASAGLIYVVDDVNELFSFDPRKLPRDPFQRIGTLRCGDRTGMPFSMSVDRHGRAWVVYTDGALYKVSITDAKCRPTPYAPGAAGFRRFGMGFVTDSPGGTTEKLFIASSEPSYDLGYIETASSLAPRVVGRAAAAEQHNPELTGTSEAQLFGFFPVDSGPSFVQEIDRSTGAARGRRWTLGKEPLGGIGAYAFAQWAGVFYIFVETYNESSELDASVRAIDRATGTYRMVLHHLPYRIVGAGVSTCAPERDQ